MAYTPTPLNNAAQLQKAPGLGSFLKTNVSSPVDERKIDYSPKEIQFLSQLKKKGIPMQQAFSFLEKKRLENPDYFQQQQMKPAKDFLGSVVAKVPQYFGNMLGGAAERSAQSVENVRQTMGQNMGVSVPVNPVSPQQAGQQVVDIGTQGRQNLEGKLGVDPTSTASSLGRGVSSLGLTYLLGDKSGLNKGISGAFSAVKNAPTFAKALPEVAKLGTLGGIENMAYAKGDIGKADAVDFGFGFVGTNIFAGLPFAKKVISKIPVPGIIKNMARRFEVSGAMNPAKYDQLKKTLMKEGVDLNSELPKDDVFGLADWMLKRDIKGEIPEQIGTLRQIAKDTQEAKKAVLNQSNTLHQDEYTKNLLDDLAEELKDSRSPERQEMFVKVTNWRNQWDNGGLRLTDIDDVRGMGWEVLNPFTSSGAVKIAKADLRGVISAVKRYIEKTADAEQLGKSLGYQGDNIIRDLNNQTQMAYGIADAMARKESTSFSQSMLSFFASRSISTSLGAVVGFNTDIGPFDSNTTYGKVGNALLGAILGTFGGSPAIKTKLALWLDNLSGKQKSQVYEWIKSKGVKHNADVEKQLNKLEKSLDFDNKNAVTGKPISESLSTPTSSSLSASQGSDTLSSSADSSLGAPATLKSNEGVSIPKKLPGFIGEKPKETLPVKETPVVKTDILPKETPKNYVTVKDELGNEIKGEPHKSYIIKSDKDGTYTVYTKKGNRNNSDFKSMADAKAYIDRKFTPVYDISKLKELAKSSKSLEDFTTKAIEVIKGDKRLDDALNSLGLKGQKNNPDYDYVQALADIYHKENKPKLPLKTAGNGEEMSKKVSLEEKTDSTTPKGMETLYEEARKYKSAEEFEIEKKAPARQEITVKDPRRGGEITGEPYKSYIIEKQGNDTYHVYTKNGIWNNTLNSLEDAYKYIDNRYKTKQNSMSKLTDLAKKSQSLEEFTEKAVNLIKDDIDLDNAINDIAIKQAIKNKDYDYVQALADIYHKENKPKLPLKTAGNGEQVSKKVSLEKKADSTPTLPLKAKSIYNVDDTIIKKVVRDLGMSENDYKTNYDGLQEKIKSIVDDGRKTTDEITEEYRNRFSTDFDGVAKGVYNKKNTTTPKGMETLYEEAGNGEQVSNKVSLEKKVDSTTPKLMETLYEEARKYKSAEEFMEKGIKKADEVGTKEFGAKDFKGGRMKVYHQTNSELEIFNKDTPTYFNTKKRLATYGNNTIEGVIDIKKPLNMGTEIWTQTEQPIKIEKARKKGYDAVTFTHYFDDNTTISQIIAINPLESVKTKSQLKQIREEANKKVPLNPKT